MGHSRSALEAQLIQQLLLTVNGLLQFRPSVRGDDGQLGSLPGKGVEEFGDGVHGLCLLKVMLLMSRLM